MRYDYIRVPVTADERAMLERMAAAGRGKTPGRVLHEMAFDRSGEIMRVRAAMKALEHIGAIRAEIVRTLRKNPSSFEMYESDLIALDDKMKEMAQDVAALIGGR